MSLMLINPRKRKTRKPRSAAQKAATARMLAARKHRSPKRRTAARRSNPIGQARVMRSSRRSVRRSSRRRNPITSGFKLGNIGDMLMNGLTGAVGGIAVNAATSFMPDTFKTGNVLYVTRAAVAILIGTVGTKVAGRRARVAAEGALAINLADFINTFAAGKLPGSQLHGVGTAGVGEYLSAYEAPAITDQGASHLDTELSRMGEYVY